MTDLVFSKQIQKKQKFFPWLKIFQRKLLKNFPNDLDLDTLLFFLLNVKQEVTNLPKSGKTKRRKALFEIIHDLFLHFWWRIQWKGRKKWCRRWKNISSDIPYTEDERSKCCEKLLYYIIYLGITLSQGAADSEWIVKIFQAIHILPSFDSAIYSSLLQVNKLHKKYHVPYIAVLKHVLCTEVVVNITVPAVYIKIIVLLRRLMRFTNDNFTISALESTALRYKPPSHIIQWMSAHAIEFPLEKLESFSKELLSKKSDDLFHKLYHVVTTPVHLEKKIETQLCQSEEIELQNNKTKVKKRKHKRSHSKVKLRDSQSDLSVDGTSDSLNPPVHSEIITSLKCKIQAHTKKKTGPKNENLCVKKLNRSTRDIEPSVSNEMLNSTFAEFKQHVLVKSSGKESNTLENFALPNESVVIKDATSDFSEERELAKSSNGPSSHKKIINISNETIHKENRSIQKSNLHDSEKTTCLNSLDTNNYTNECNNETTGASNHNATFYGTLLPRFQCFSNSNLFDTKTFDNQINLSQTQRQETSPGKMQSVSSVDIQKMYPSTSLNFVQLPNDNLTSEHCKTSTNFFNESINSNQIHANTDNPSLATPASTSSSILRAPHRLKALCDVPPNVFHENMNTDKAIASTKSIGINVNENTYGNGIINIKLPNSGNSSADVCNSRDQCASWMGNQSNSSLHLKGLFDDHRWGESQPLIPTVNRSLEPTQNCLVNYTKSSIVNPEISYVNSFVTPRTENKLGNITISQNDISPNCVVDCKIVSDYEPNTMQHESVASFKVVINVSCKTQEDAPNQHCENIFGNFNNASENYLDSSQNQGSFKTQEDAQNQQSEHIFGNFNNTPGNYFGNSQNQVNFKMQNDTQNQQSDHTFGNFNNASENYFDSSQNLFCTVNPTSEMPKLKPFYEDYPQVHVAVPPVATPPDSELEISIPTSSSKQSENGFLTNTYFEKSQNNPNYSSTPKDAKNKFHRKISHEDSDFRTPQTSDCESSSEDNVENVNLSKSPVTHTSTVKSTVDDILERLNYRKRLHQDKSESHNATAAQCPPKENVSYRSFTGMYSYDELSEDSTISQFSRVSTTDDELNKSTKYFKTSDVCKQKPLNVSKRKKNENSKKYTKDDQEIPEKTSCNITNGYNLRPRAKLNKPPYLEV